ncbi:MAG: hypothetical protein QM729_05670 [Solirubrobacterales bacterium]
MSPRFAGLGAIASLAVFVALFAPGAAGAEGVEACDLLPPAKIKAELGFPRLRELRETSTDEFAELQPQADWASAINTVCDRMVWRGSSTPKTRLARDAMLRAGEAAVVGVQTWVPYLESPQVDYWYQHAFGNLIDDFHRGRFHLTEKISGRATPSKPKAEGYPDAGVTIVGQGPLRGVVAATACWWHAANHEVTCVRDEEAADRPAVADLNAFAGAIVPSFLAAT